MITRNGQPVAMLSPCPQEKIAIDETVEALFALRKGISLGGLSINEIKEEGRR